MMRAAKVRNFLPLRLVLLFLDHSIDMDVSDDAPLDNDEVSSEPAGGLEDDASGSENNQDDDIEVEDIGQDAIAEEEEEEEDEVSFHSILSCTFEAHCYLPSSPSPHQHLRQNQ